MGEMIWDRAASRWRKQIEFAPLRTIEGIKAAVLLIDEAADPVVLVAESSACIESSRGERLAFAV
jgi:hypothetical protein